MTEERYEDFLGPLPEFAYDSRQSTFLSAVGPAGAPKKVMFDERLGKVEIANVGRGWPATRPDLGFLHDGLKTLIANKRLDPESKKQVAQFVGWAVQRVIRTTVRHADDVTHVQFWTKDDHSVYQYGFSVNSKT